MASDKCAIGVTVDEATGITVVSCKTCSFGGSLPRERGGMEAIEFAKASLRDRCRITTKAQ